jgi:putative nucleotidyltransferase with HDIG domain
VESEGITPEGIDAKREEFQRVLGISLPQEDFQYLANKRFSTEIEDAILQLVLPLMSRQMVGDSSLVEKEKGRGILIRNLKTGEETAHEDFAPILDLEEAERTIERNAREVLRDYRWTSRRIILEASQSLLRPTLTSNRSETRERVAKAKEEIEPVYFQVKKGEMIAREGDRISQEQLIKLEGIRQFKRGGFSFLNSTGIFLVLFLFTVVVYRLSSRSIRGFAPKMTDLIFIAVILVATLSLLKLYAYISEIAKAVLPTIPLNSFFYAFPFALGAMLISAVLTVEAALVFAIIFSTLAAFLLENNFYFFLFAFVGSIIAAQEVFQCKDRKTLIRAGLTVAVANMAFVLCFNLIGGSVVWGRTLFEVGMAFLGGVTVGIAATGLIPVVEILCDYTTNIKLLELADLNHPLIRDLAIKAPGTYHHSVIVGNLVEEAAKVTGANPLLGRVASYYHDIGKITKPLYFIENQKGTESKHDKLSPTMSSLVIVSHVREGVDLAKEYKLGRSLTDIIQQHHGTSFITFFYQKAMSQPNPSLESVSEKEFRYAGPKPQTKEAALVMLADAVEATSKTLADPTPARIQGLVQRLITNIFTEGQLDESELTLKDLHLIAGSFNRILTGIFHHRIDYPGQEAQAGRGKKQANDLDKKPAGPDKDKPKVAKESGKRDLRRLGISKSGS